MMKKVAVVILNYKVMDQALKCVSSVKGSSYKNVEIILIDNDSGDDIKDEIKDVIFIQTGQNLGYTGGNNLGIKKALENQADYIFILNPDTTIEKDTIERLVNAAEKNQAQVLGPKILFTDKEKIWYAGGVIDKENILGTHRGLDERDYGQYDQQEETEFVTGGALFARREVFEKIGLFDDRYFLYLEDVDFCFRAKNNGFKILYVPSALVYHKNAQSTGLGSPRQDYYITRNRLLFAFKFLPWRNRLALLKHIVTSSNIVTRRQALFDFLLGHFGKGPY